MRHAPWPLHPDLCFSQEETDLLEPIRLEELDTLMDDLDQRSLAPTITNHQAKSTMPQQTRQAAQKSVPKIIIYGAPAKVNPGTPPRILERVFVEIPSTTSQQLLHPDSAKKRKRSPTKEPTNPPSTPRARKLTVTTPPSPTLTSIHTPTRRSLSRTVKLQSQTPTRRHSSRLAKPKSTPAKQASTSQTQTPAQSQVQIQVTPRVQTPIKLPIPTSWTESSAEDRLLFDLRKANNDKTKSWKEVAAEWNQITGRDYSESGLSRRWNRIHQDIGLPPEGMEWGLELDEEEKGSS